VNLNRLSNRESLSMVSHLLGTDELDPALEELILEKTEGVPFFVEEFVKSLQDLGTIEKRDDTWRIADHVQALTIPAEIQDVIMSRLDALPEGAKNLIQTGSVAGREFSHDLIQRVTGLPEPELLSRFSVLKDAELHYERGIYPQATYVFKHALIQDVANQSLLANTRQQQHQRIAQVLEEHCPETADARPELVGHHYTEAGAADEAVPYWQRAGEKAVRHSAYTEGIAHFTKGLELLQNLSESAVRNRREVELRLALAPALGVAKGYGALETKQNYDRARELCPLGDTRYRPLALWGLHVVHFTRAEYQAAYEIAEEFLGAAQTEQEQYLLMLGHRMLGATLFCQGEDFSAARSHLSKAEAYCDPQWPPAVVFRGSGAHAKLHPLAYEFLMLDWLGYPDQAVKKCQEALDFAGSLSHPLTVATARFFSAWLHYSRRDVSATQAQAEAAVNLSTEYGFPFWRTGGTVLLGWALCRQGQTERGIETIREGLIGWKAIGTRQWVTCGLAQLAEACWKGGQIEDGLSAINEALALVRKNGERWWETEIYCLKGHLLLAQSPDHEAEAEKCFRQAIEIARERKTKSLELKAVVSLSRLLRDQGKREAACDALADVYGWFTEGFDTPYLEEAQALLDELST
jgi:tetratricopeptide (TPR) repeat protein